MTDALFPNVLTVQPDGTISADFTGLVHAKGLNLDAQAAGGFANVNAVRWLRTSDSAVVAELVATSAAGSEQLQLAAITPASGDSSTAELWAEDDQGNFQAMLQVSQQGRGASGSVTAWTPNGNNRTIINQSGQSEFVQLPGPQKLKLFGQYAVTTGLAIPGNSSQALTITDGAWNLVNPWHIFAYLAENPGGWMDHCSWAVTGNTSTSITLNIANNQANAATGQAYFYVLNSGN